MYQTIFETSNTPIVLLDDDMLVCLVNAKFEQFSGYKKAEIEHRKNWHDFFVKNNWEKVKECHLRSAHDENICYRSYDFRFVDKKNNVKDVRANLSVFAGTKNAAIVFLFDIGECKRREKEIARMSSHDALTGLPNRWLFNRHLELACTIVRKMGLPEETVSSIRIASMIHDIGKVHIPGEILSKPGKVIDSEFNMIKMHCELSCDIIGGDSKK